MYFVYVVKTYAFSLFFFSLQTFAVSDLEELGKHHGNLQNKKVKHNTNLYKHSVHP